MDPLIFLLLVIIILAGGFIGMFADNLGRKIGKKKLSFRNMRPKHVARLGTFFAGILISTLTIVLVFFTSSDVRIWIQRGYTAIKDAQVLRAQNGQLEGEIKDKTSQISQLDLDSKQARQNLQDAQGKLASIQLQLTTANTRLAGATKRVEEGKRALAVNQRLLQTNQELLKARQSDLKVVAANLKAAKVNYATLKSNYGTVNQQRIDAEARVVSLGQEADTVRTTVVQLRKDSAQLTLDKAQTKYELDIARADLHSEQEDLRQVQSALKSASAELETARLYTNKFQSLVGVTRANPMVFQYKQEVQRIQIGAHLSQGQARQAVEKLIDDADKVARARGAVTAPGNRQSVFIPFQSVRGAEEDPKQLEDDFITSITGQDHEIVLIAQAALNTFQGEAVPINILDMDNPIVYHKNEVLAQFRFGKNWPRKKVLDEFNDLMDQQVHDKIKDKMIPVAGQEASLINLPPSETLDVVERLTRAPRDTVLLVTCRAETRAADSLQLDFKYK